MLEIFVLVERKSSVFRKVIAWLVLLAAAACLVAACTSMGFLTVAIVLVGLWYWLFFKGELEYEYSYFDGELRFAKVMNKSRRKSLGSYSIDDVVQIAPAGDSSVTNYENNSETKFKDYTSRNKGVPYYDIVLKSANGILIIKAELDDKYIDGVCMKYASKVKRRQV